MPRITPLPLLLLLAANPAGAQSSGRMPSIVHPEGVVSSTGQAAASGQRGPGGLFWFNAEINGAGMRMALDTGASTVVIRNEDAAKAGIDTGSLRYTATTSTPNGQVNYALVTLPSLTVGDITRRNVRALVSPPGKLDTNLLGQTFLARIGGFRQEGNRMVLLDRVE